MNSDIKALLGVLAVAGVILVISRPGIFKKANRHKNLQAPKKADKNDIDYENSVIALKAMRDAINDHQPKQALDELNREILSEYNLKVHQLPTGKLYTSNRSGEKIAEEK